MGIYPRIPVTQKCRVQAQFPDILPKDTLPKDIWPKDTLPNGYFADGHFVERTI